MKPSSESGTLEFRFEFERRYRPLLTLLDVTGRGSYARIAPTELMVRFGPWSCRSPLDNIEGVQECPVPTGWKEIGPRGRGNGTALYGTTTAGGVAVEFRNPVQAADLSGVTRHRRLVLTLADRPRFVDAFGRACGLN